MCLSLGTERFFPILQPFVFLFSIWPSPADESWKYSLFLCTRAWVLLLPQTVNSIKVDGDLLMSCWAGNLGARLLCEP